MCRCVYIYIHLRMHILYVIHVSFFIIKKESILVSCNHKKGFSLSLDAAKAVRIQTEFVTWRENHESSDGGLFWFP